MIRKTCSSFIPDIIITVVLLSLVGRKNKVSSWINRENIACKTAHLKHDEDTPQHEEVRNPADTHQGRCCHSERRKRGWTGFQIWTAFKNHTHIDDSISFDMISSELWDCWCVCSGGVRWRSLTEKHRLTRKHNSSAQRLSGPTACASSITPNCLKDPDFKAEQSAAPEETIDVYVCRRWRSADNRIGTLSLTVAGVYQHLF